VSNNTGYVLPALAIGFGSFLLKPTRGFFPTQLQGQPNIPGLIATTTIEEVHNDDLEITEHPVELGAPIADHMFKRPPTVIIQCAWSNSPQLTDGLIGAAVGLTVGSIPALGAVVGAVRTLSAAQSMLSGNGVSQVNAIYQQLLDLQQSGIPFSVYTGKRVYRNMLFKTLATTTAKGTENSLVIRATCKAVIIATTSVVNVPINPDAQANAEKTSPVINYGQKQLLNSSLGSGFFGVTP
jgi:hypothetical protein